MVEKPYLWENGAKLEDHSRRKHKVLREYFARYLAVRCQLPHQTKFRLAIVEGFAGGGRYEGGAVGSPIIFLEELRIATEKFNIKRLSDGVAPIDIECLLLLNDESAHAIELLKANVEPLLAAIKDQVRKLHLEVHYSCMPFDGIFSDVKNLLERGNYRNVIFNLDQCGHSQIRRATLVDIMTTFRSAEIFYTFAISALLAFLRKNDPDLLKVQLRSFGDDLNDLSMLESRMTSNQWLGLAERLVFDSFKRCAPFVSPFSINNPGGWRYWLIHFANSYRARQEYNNILHQNSSMQAHFGRSGLRMLSFDPDHDGNSLYLFADSDRERARKQLDEDIPRLIADFGDAVEVGDFYGTIYNATPAHMDDINSSIIENPDIEVVTAVGGERRKANTIRPDDTMRMKLQRSFFPMFPRK